MDLNGSKQVCGICKHWKGKRLWAAGKAIVKSAARGQCQRLQKVKPPHGGCDQWEKFEGENDDTHYAA